MTTKTNTKKAQQRETAPPALIAWHITERGEKKFWTRIGACWKHEDGEGFSLQLDLFPAAGGRVVLRTPKKQDEDADAYSEDVDFPVGEDEAA